jgi:hypothetical protein
VIYYDGNLANPLCVTCASVTSAIFIGYKKTFPIENLSKEKTSKYIMSSSEILYRVTFKNRRFGGAYRLHHQGEKIQRARNNVSMLRRNTFPKRRLLQKLHAVTSQNTAFFIVNAVKTSNLNIKLTGWSFLAEMQCVPFEV